MSANLEAPSSSMDALKWVVAIALLAGAVVGNYMFEDQSVLLRAIGVVIAIAAGLGVASQTIKGRTFIAFAKEAKLEVRKVVWPTRQGDSNDFNCNGRNGNCCVYTLFIRRRLVLACWKINWFGV